MPSLSTLESTLNLTFTDKNLLEQAFNHRSFLNENKGKFLASNERLEFLGDAVLELATSEFLYNELPQKPEGELTSLRSSLVKTETLSSVARQLNLGLFLKMSKGEEQTGGRTNASLLANTVEALIGAIYLDQGFAASCNFAQKYIFIKLPQILRLNLHRDFKSTLQETVQAQGKTTPVYETLSAIGPDHHKVFTIKVVVDGKTLGQGTGPSKQKAEQAAAASALEKIQRK